MAPISKCFTNNCCCVHLLTSSFFAKKKAKLIKDLFSRYSLKTLPTISAITLAIIHGTLHLYVRFWIFWQLVHDQSKMCKNASVWTVLNFDWRSLKNRYDQTIFLLLPSQREPSVNVHIDVTSDALNFVANTVVT